ncbi:hypothetical protein F442_22675 [Phytophthora nicotianae P10297]|uniref:Uncharacterized protein n=1 Tax=Phytophthora nicotianae P10297 TaxID=1317064 RepID=W2XZ94_PHYNI|nr:hypothetical protein F442_22675 [Phytophthora nicotianae P10297]
MILEALDDPLIHRLQGSNCIWLKLVDDHRDFA